MKQDPRPTIGQICTDLEQKTPDTLNAIELTEARVPDIVKEFQSCVQQAIKDFGPDTDFYIEAKLGYTKFRHATKHLHSARLTCPEPSLDQTVYKYDHKKQDDDLLWQIPDLVTVTFFYRNKLNIVPEQRELLQYVLDFLDGTLHKKWNQLYKGSN